MKTEEFNLSEKECNILTNKVELDKPEGFLGMPKESLNFEKGFFVSDVKEFIKRQLEFEWKSEYSKDLNLVVIPINQINAFFDKFKRDAGDKLT
jgi:hypothetical protein